MNNLYKDKASIEDIRNRFDNDVERFSNLETGQTATIDAPLAMELITNAAVACTPNAKNILDIGCGAGNNTLKLLQLINPVNCDLLDLSKHMLDRAFQRVSESNKGEVRIIHEDFRKAKLDNEHYDIILAAAVLHHLRDDSDWENSFKKIYDITAPGGSVWITDLVIHENEKVQDMMWNRYGDYLIKNGGEGKKNKVFEYIAKEDTPRPVSYQLDLLRKVGFKSVDILHKNSCFAAFGAVKAQ
jgi:tRNA (cmo5U34)-methyltransferase